MAGQPGLLVRRASGRRRALVFVLMAALSGVAMPVAPAEQGLAAQVAAAQGYRETIPDTVVGFEMVPVPAGTIQMEGLSVAVRSLPDRAHRGDVGHVRRVRARPRRAAARGGGRNRASVSTLRRSRLQLGTRRLSGDQRHAHAAEEFCNGCRPEPARRYRLPTEAEWVRAAGARGRTEVTPANREADDLARGERERHDPRRRQANAGRTRTPRPVRECHRMGRGRRRRFVTRGGSFRNPLDATGPAARIPYDISWQERDPQLPKSKWWLSDGPFVGFRLAGSA